MLRNWVTMLFTPDSVNAGDFGSLINNAISFYLLVFAGVSNLRFFFTCATCCISAPDPTGSSCWGYVASNAVNKEYLSTDDSSLFTTSEAISPTRRIG